MAKPAPELNRAQYRLCFPRDAFLRAVGVVYAAAFASIARQIRGLYGEDGLEPVDIFLHRLAQRDDRLRSASPLQRIAIYPTAVWLHDALQWSPSFMMQVIALAGLVVSLLMQCHAKWRTMLPQAFVWFSYLSIVQCGQTFMQFQWDSFLLEVGFLAIWTAPWWHTTRDTFEAPAAVVWALRFLFFKFMFMSGAVKIQSKCPTWLGLTALEYHFATQPLPLPLSWYAHQLPPLFLRFGVAATLLFEGPWAFFIIAPAHRLRQFSALMQILLQLMIMLTGNYNFFNLLAVVMALTLLDVREPAHRVNDPKTLEAISTSLPELIRMADAKWNAFQHDPRVAWLSLGVATAYCWYSFVEVFTFGYDAALLGQASWEQCLSSCWIKFVPTVDDIQAWIAQVLPVSIAFCAGLISVAGLWQTVMIFSVPVSSHQGSRLLKTTYILLSSAVAAWVFISSTLTISILDRPFQHSMPPFVFEAYEATSHWRIASPYGLFRTMTGVGTVERNGQQYSAVARPEIILEGTDDGGATWKAYHFQYKPGDVHTAPRVNVPLQPRLDWQMWFAALGNYQGAPWIVHLVDKLLRQSPDVKALLDSSRDPFPHDPPQAIRAQLYYYDFTRLNSAWNRAIPSAVIVNNTKEAAWWSRSLDSEYLPALEQGNPTVAQFVQHHFGREPHTYIQPIGCDAASTSSSQVQAWSCHTLRYLVEWPVVSGVILAVLISSVAIWPSTTQTPTLKRQ